MTIRHLVLENVIDCSLPICIPPLNLPNLHVSVRTVSIDLFSKLLIPVPNRGSVIPAHESAEGIFHLSHVFFCVSL